MNNQDYNTLNSSVQNWLKEKEDYDLRRNKVFGLNPKFYLWVFGILFVYAFFIQDAKFSESKNSEYTAFGTFAGKVYIFDNHKWKI